MTDREFDIVISYSLYDARRVGEQRGVPRCGICTLTDAIFALRSHGPGAKVAIVGPVAAHDAWPAVDRELDVQKAERVYLP